MAYLRVAFSAITWFVKWKAQLASYELSLNGQFHLEKYVPYLSYNQYRN